jgi:TIR domain
LHCYNRLNFSNSFEMLLSDVFISYSRKDSVFVDSLNQALKKAGKDVWVDWEDIPYSSTWWTEISRAIEGASAFICVLSPDYFLSKTCLEEVKIAEQFNKRIVPVLYREFDAELNQSNSIAKINWLPFRERDDFTDSFNMLIETVNKDLGWLKFHTRLLVRALEWSAQKNDSSYHLYGKDLEEAQVLQKSGGNKLPALNTMQQNYIEASKGGAIKLLQKQLRGFYIVALVYSFVQMFVIYIWSEEELSETAMIRLSWVWLPALSFALAGFTIGKNSIKKSLIAMAVVMVLFFLFFQFLWDYL